MQMGDKTVCWNENQLAKLHPVRRTKSDAERAPWDFLTTLKHLEHLCSFKILLPSLFLSLDSCSMNGFCLPKKFDFYIANTFKVHEGFLWLRCYVSRSMK